MERATSRINVQLKTNHAINVHKSHVIYGIAERMFLQFFEDNLFSLGWKLCACRTVF